MRLITAILWPDSLDAVHDALNPAEAYVMSAAPVIDDHYLPGFYRGHDYRQPRPRCRLEIVVLNDLATPEVIQAIEREAAKAGEQKGLVVVTPIDDVVQLPRS